MNLDAGKAWDVDYTDLMYLKSFPNCHPGADCFGPEAVCPGPSGCCGFFYSGCQCDASGRVTCLTGSSSLCDICMPSGDTWPDTSVAAACDPATTQPSCQGDIAKNCVTSAGTSYLVTHGCPFYTHCNAGTCVNNPGIVGKACTSKTKCWYNLTCVGLDAGMDGACSTKCGECKGNKCIAWASATASTIGVGHCTGPWPKLGNIAVWLSPCDNDGDCDAGQECALVPMAGKLGPDIPVPQKACVPAGW